MNIYVGNLGSDVTEDLLRETFEAFGQVDSARIIKDKFSDTPRGFAFVEMSDDGEAQSAISSLNGKDLEGKSMIVNEARPREGGGGGGGARRGGGGGGGRRGGGGGGPRRY